MKSIATKIPKVDTILEKITSVCYFDLFRCLVTTAESIKNDTSKTAEYKLLALLAKGCSLNFSIENEETPLEPYIVLSSQRSANIDDFTSEELDIYEGIIQQIEDFRLKARIADILYLAPNFNGDNNKRAKYAQMAVNAYSQFPVSEESWFCGGRESTERLCSLGLKTQGKKRDFKEKLTNRLLTACLNKGCSNGVYTYQLADLLYKYKLGKQEYNTVAEHIRKHGDIFVKENRHRVAIKCYELAYRYFKRLGYEKEASSICKLIADTYESEITFLAPLFGQENLVKARAALKQIPNIHKTPDIQLKISTLDSRIEELLETSNTQTVEYACKLDITPCVIDAKKAVSGLNKYEALLGLLKIASICNKEELISSTIAHIKANPIQYCCIRYRFHHSGRCLEKYDGGVYFSKELNEDNPILKEALVKKHEMLITLYAIGRILPALEVLHLEHRYSYADFLEICELSCIIPAGRSILFAKGLHAGYNYDFATAAHILAPQFEHLVRCILKERGIRTTIEKVESGKVDEKSLNALVSCVNAQKYLGENFSFTVESLFCDDRGANIRNEVAHGLVDSKVGNQASYIYAWWLILRVIIANQYKTNYQ